MNEFSVVGVIPARLASTRLPGKLLKEIHGKSVLQRVYEQCLKANSLKRVHIITDHNTIFEHALSFGATVSLSKREHISGTDRIAELMESLSEYTHVINIQGDEPFIDPVNINSIVTLMRERNCDIASLAIQLNEQNDLQNPNFVKVVTDLRDKALYFSRAGIPFLRDQLNHSHYEWKKHVGIYGFKREILLKLSQLQPSSLELIESLEQLRWLENGYDIIIRLISNHSNGIDTAEDLEAAISYAEKNNL